MASVRLILPCATISTVGSAAGSERVVLRSRTADPPLVLRRATAARAAFVGTPASSSGSSAKRAIQSCTESVCARWSGLRLARSSAARISLSRIGSARGSALRSFLRRSRNPACTSRQRRSSSCGLRANASSPVRCSSSNMAESTPGTGSNASRGTRTTTEAAVLACTKAVRYDQSPGAAATRSATSNCTSKTMRAGGTANSSSRCSSGLVT